MASQKNENTDQFAHRMSVQAEPRILQQKKAFTGWVNAHLQQRSMNINNLQDISQVSPLIHLLQILEKKPLDKITRNHIQPRNNFDKMEGMIICLTHIKSREASNASPFSPETLLLGQELKLYLALIWRIIVLYGIQMAYDNNENDDNDINEETKEQQQQQQQQPQKQKSKKKIIKSAEDCLKEWVNGQLVEDELKINNFTKDWIDGKILICLMNKALKKSNAIKYSNIKHMSNKQLLDHILETNHKYLNIPQLLDSNSLIHSPNKEAIMTYVLLLKTAIETKDQKKVSEQKEQIVFKRAQSIMVTGTDNKRIWFEDYYQLEELLGEPGTFGMAYKCYKKTDKNKTSYAVKKIIKTKFYFNKNTLNVLENMKNEIKVLKTLAKNQYICSLHEVYEDRNYLYLLLDYLSGGELLSKIEEEDGLTEMYSVSILKQILSAINVMHENNIVHLDLKPDNILFVTSRHEKIKIIDFGESKLMTSKDDKINVKIGTPYYMSPQIIIDNPSYNPFKSDVWAVGVITFCMLFGYIPFYSQDNDEKVIFENIKNGFKPKICAGYGAWFPMDIPVSNEAMNFISGMLTYNPKDRFSIEECLNHKWLNTPVYELTFPQNIQKSTEIIDKPETFRGGYEVYINQDDYCEIKTQMDEIIDDNIIRQGYLYKEGKLFKTWKKRWFVLNKNGCVSYYGSHLEQTPKGTFNIKNYNQIIRSKKIKCGIILCTADRNYKLVCANNKSRNEWINSFKIFKKNEDSNKLELEKIKNLLKNGVKCGAGDIWWIQKNCHSNNKYVLKLQQHTKENDMIKFSRKIGFWSNHTDKYRIILGEKQVQKRIKILGEKLKTEKDVWMELYHSSKWNDVQQKYDHYKSILML